MGYVVNKELESLLASFEFEEYGHERLVGFEGSAERLDLQVLVSILHGGRQEQLWRITATDVHDSLLHLGDAGIRFDDEHPILHRYSEPGARLSIRGVPNDPIKLLADLPSVLPQYGPHNLCLDVLAAGYGIVANGPLPWVRRVEELLSGTTLKPT
jgi:hypothetical protein